MIATYPTTDVFATMETISTDNATDIATNASNIADNTADIAANSALISSNQSRISANETNIATNTTDIGNILDGTSHAAVADSDSNGDDIHTNFINLQDDVDNLRSIARSYGNIEYNTEDVTEDILNSAVSEVKLTAASSGDLVYDLDNHEWEYNGTIWVDNGE